MSALSHLALVGPRAAGKSTLARRLAERLGWVAVDTDELLAAEVGCPAGEFLARAGEAAFRRHEAAICQRMLGAAAAATDRPSVVALGGGAVLAPATRALLRAPGVFTVLVTAPLDELERRQAAAGGGRPPLTDLPLREEVRRIWEERRPLYDEVAEMRINTKTSNVDACVARILAKIARSS